MNNKQARHYFINAKEKRVDIITDVVDLALLQKYVEGPIQSGLYNEDEEIDSLDTLYVNEEGLLMDKITYGFYIGNNEFRGNGVIVGPEIGEVVMHAQTDIDDLYISFFDIE